MSIFIISENRYLILGFVSLFYNHSQKIIGYTLSDFKFDDIKNDDIVFIDSYSQGDSMSILRHLKICGARVFFLVQHENSIAKMLMYSVINTRVELKYIIHSLLFSMNMIPADRKEELKLTKKEQLIISMVLRGYAENKISAYFSIRERTVRYHINAVLRKLQINSIADLYRLKNIIYNNFFI